MASAHLGLAQPAAALCFPHSPRMQPAAAQSQLQKEQSKPKPAGSKGCWHQGDTTVQGRAPRAGHAAPGPAGACPASTARLGAACQSIHRDIFGERGICSCQLDLLLLPLVFRATLLLQVQIEWSPEEQEQIPQSSTALGLFPNASDLFQLLGHHYQRGSGNALGTLI